VRKDPAQGSAGAGGDRVAQRGDGGVLLEPVAHDGRVALGGEEGGDRELVMERPRDAERGVLLRGGGARRGDAGLGTGSGAVDDDGDPVCRPRGRRLGGGRQAGHEADE
jgi:hypothetical protein